MVTRAGGSLVVIGKDVEPVQQLTVPDVKGYLEETQRKGFKSGTPLCRLALAIDLSQYATSRTVTFGATLSGRDFPMTDIEYVAGPTIATVPRQLEVPPEMTVVEFLQYVQKTGAMTLPHQHLGLRRIQGLGSAAKQACEFTTFLVVNTYGPTEAYVMFTSRDISPDSPHEKPSINIGAAPGAAT
ncbi:hypothetical protein ACHAPU_010128 [Fusarium lateritium]